MVYTRGTSRTGAVPDFAKKVGGTGLAYTNHNPHAASFFKGGQRFSLLGSSTSYFRGMWNHIQFGADSLPAGVFQTDGVFFEGQYTGAGVDTLLATSLRLTIKNVNTGAANDPLNAIKLVIAQYLLRRLEVMAAGDAVDDTIYPDQMQLDQAAMMTCEMKALIGAWMGWDTGGPTTKVQGDYSNQTSYSEDGFELYPGDDRSIVLPLHSFLSQARLFLPSKNKDPRIRVVCSNEVLTWDTGANTTKADVALIGVQFLSSGILYDDEVRIKLKEYYDKNNTSSRVIVHERQTESFNQINPNSVMGDTSLTVFNGAFANMDIYVIRNEATSQELYNSNRIRPALVNPNDPTHEPIVPLRAITLNDSSSNPVFFNDIYVDFLRGVQAALANPKSWIYQQVNYVPIHWALDACDTIKTGRNTGGIVMDSKYHLKLLGGNFSPDSLDATGTAVTTTNFIGVFLGRRYAYLHMNKGEISLQKL